jgi:hypothetical protein
MGKQQQRVSAATFARVSEYASVEPSFTIAFAAWELELSRSAIGWCVAHLLEQGAIVQIEPREGPYAAVYEHVPERRRGARMHVVTGGTSERELDDRRVAYTTEAAAG